MKRKASTGARAGENPLAVSDSFKRYVLEQLEELGDVTPRSMFGAVGLYHRETFFGILAGDVLYLKVDESTRQDYERLGMSAFNPYPGRGGTMRYYAVPVDVLESGAELARWARKAAAVGPSGRRR